MCHKRYVQHLDIT